MNDILFTRKAQWRRVLPIVLTLLAAAALAVVFLQIGFGKPVLLQLVLVLCLCAAVYLFVRYISVSYVYGITAEAGEAFFTVTQQQGGKSVLQCKLSLASFLGVEREDSAHPFSAENCTKVYRFSPLFLPEYYDVLYFEDGGRIAVKIHADDAFLQALSVAAEAARNTEEQERREEEPHAD